MKRLHYALKNIEAILCIFRLLCGFCKNVVGPSFGHEMKIYDAMISGCMYFGLVHVFEAMFNSKFVCVYLFLLQ